MILQRYFRVSLGRRLAVAFLLGAVVGWLLGPKAAALEPFGTLLVRLLQMLVLPVVISTIVVGVGSAAPSALGRIGREMLLLYLGLALVAAALGATAAFVTRAGSGVRLPGASTTAPPSPPLESLLLGLVPANPVAAMANDQLLAVVVFAVLFALALAKVRHSANRGSAEVVHRFFEGVAGASYTMLQWVMQYTPIGTFALIAITFGERSGRAAAAFVTLIVTVYVAQMLLCIACVLLLPLFRIEIARFLHAVRDPLITAFVTGSSAATLPVEMNSAEHRLQVDKSIFAVTLPVGIGVSKIGTAVHLAAATVFAANLAGLELTSERLGLITLLAWLASIATPPISGGALLMFGFIFTQAGVPVAAIGLLAGIPFVGKLNTSVNSLGRLVTTAIVGRSAAKS